MQINILEEKDNVFFKRKDLYIKIAHAGISTPSKKDLTKEIAAKTGKPEDHVVIDYIFTKSGLGESEARAKVYEEKPKVKEKEGAKTETKEGKAEEKPKENKGESKNEAQPSEAK
jgi:ribosomal protein S24E